MLGRVPVAIRSAEWRSSASQPFITDTTSRPTISALPPAEAISLSSPNSSFPQPGVARSSIPKFTCVEVIVVKKPIPLRQASGS